MGMNKAQKHDEVQELSERFTNDEIVVLAHYSGLTVEKITELRGQSRKEQALFKVTKNTLARRALAGTKFESMAEMFKGPTGMVSSKDPVAAARVAYNFAKANDKFVILGGALGSRILDAKGVEALAKLPSLDEIRSKLLGLLQAPASKLVGVLQAPARQLVGVTKAYGEKQ